MSALALAVSDFPRRCASDGDEVGTALEVAGTCWQRGDLEDTVRWLRRASQAAAQSDHLERAMELSKWVAAVAHEGLERDEETSPGPRSGVVPAGTTVQVPPPPRLPNVAPEPPPEAIQAPPRAEQPDPTANSVPLLEALDEDEDEVPTVVRRVPVPLSHEGPEVIEMDAGLVVVRRVGERVEVTPLPAGGVAPPGSAVVMMVAPSAYDADLLACWLR